MGSIVVRDVGGHHFQSTMFGANTHHQPQEPSSAHHNHEPPLRPASPHRIASPGDVSMTESAPVPGHSASAQRPRQHSNTEPNRHVQNVAQQPQQPPPSPRFRPQSQHTPVVSAPPAFPNTRPVASSDSSSAQQSPIGSLRSPHDSVATSPRRIKVKNLAHIQSFATDESSLFSQTRSLSRRQRRDPSDIGPQYEISEMPVSDIIEMVAGLLTKITTTNDRQHEHLHRQIPPSEGTAGLSPQTTSVLAFHGKNVPSISILSYLSRIHKYCPTTYEVFLSLLVYFDRMTERVNSGPIQSLRQANQNSHVVSSNGDQARPASGGGLSLSHDADGSADAANVEQDASSTDTLNSNLSHFFVVDSFNIHRLVIAGVTCASKFFSDVFYTNSRYAKVGGLPLGELNHLEIQFLLLNDFRLSVPLEEMEAYGTMLVEFYAREVLAQQQAAGRGPSQGGRPANTTA